MRMKAFRGNINIKCSSASYQGSRKTSLCFCVALHVALITSLRNILERVYSGEMSVERFDRKLHVQQLRERAAGAKE